MTDESDFSMHKVMQESEGGCICEPYMVQTIYKGGQLYRLDLPEVAARHYAELVAERDRLAKALEEALTAGYFGDAQETHARSWAILEALQEKTDE